MCDITRVLWVRGTSESSNAITLTMVTLSAAGVDIVPLNVGQLRPTCCPPRILNINFWRQREKSGPEHINRQLCVYSSPSPAPVTALNDGQRGLGTIVLKLNLFAMRHKSTFSSYSFVFWSLKQLAEVFGSVNETKRKR